MTQGDAKRAELLAAIEREPLETFLLERAEWDDDFALWLDAILAASMPVTGESALDPGPYGRRAEEVMASAASKNRGQRGGWSAGFDDAPLEELIGMAEPLLAAGRGVDVLALLTSVLGAMAQSWSECAGWDETAHEFFPRLDRMIAQAVLMDAISTETREDLADELCRWQGDLADYGVADSFCIAIDACMQGWDEPGLQDALAGRGTIWPLRGQGDIQEEKLTRARLAALEAMGQVEAYLNFSRAAGFHCDHGVKLAQSGRVDEALAVAHAQLIAPGDILRLVEAIAATGEVDTALDLAAWGLTLPAPDEEIDDWRTGARKTLLACWLREAAREAGRGDLMLTAARIAFEESLAHEDFRSAKRLACDTEWPALRETLLATLLAARHASDRIEILLDEDMIDEAVACVDPDKAQFFSVGDKTLERLAERAWPDHPDWAIKLAFQMAGPIMNEGRSSRYETAAQWLGVAARVFAASGRAEEWSERLEDLIERHRRKHTLLPLLEALRCLAY